MILVWIGVAIIALALIWLIGYAIGMVKGMKSTMTDLSKTQAHIQEKIDEINNRKDGLNKTITEIQSDIDYKKSSVNEVVLESKFLKNNVTYLAHNVKKRLRNKN